MGEKRFYLSWTKCVQCFWGRSLLVVTLTFDLEQRFWPLTLHMNLYMNLCWPHTPLPKNQIGSKSPETYFGIKNLRYAYMFLRPTVLRRKHKFAEFHAHMGGADKDKSFVWKYGKTVNIFMFRVIFFRSPYTSKTYLEKSWNTLKRILVNEKFVSRNFSFPVYV